MTIKACLVKAQSVTLVLSDNKTHNINTSHPNYDRIREAAVLRDWSNIERLLDINSTIEKSSDGKLYVKDGRVYYRSVDVDVSELDQALATRMIEILRANGDSRYLVLFLENLMQNPSKDSIKDLYGWLEKSDLPLTDDGCFLAYKLVDKNYRDYRTHTFDNSVGKVVRMDRSMVNPNRNETCSRGLHFCSEEYLPHYGDTSGRTVIVKINPKDVVSIPTDYNLSKGRCCEYEVVGEVANKAKLTFNKPVVNDAEIPGSNKPLPKRDKFGRFVKTTGPLRDPKTGRYLKAS